jgi:dolichyl-phosphate beta-glucosyltransferase
MIKPLLSIVIPAYNEAKNFKSGVLTAPLAYLKAQKFSWELIFVNDGSTDETGKLLKKFALEDKRMRLITIPHGGKAAAVIAGVKATRGRYVLFTDFDQSTPLSQWTNFQKAHTNGADVVIGVRGGGAATKHDSLVRKIRSSAFVTLVQLVALPGVHDTQCGFKSFTSESAAKIFNNLKVSQPNGIVTGGYMGAFDVEVLFLARLAGYKISECPVNWVKVESDKLNIWKEPLMMLRDVFLIRLYAILGKYNELS